MIGVCTSAHSLDRVERILKGEDEVDTSDIRYNFDGHHLGVIAKGSGAREAVRAMARPLDCQLFLVDAGGGAVWAWLGGRRAIEPLEVQEKAPVPGEVSVALGESAGGLDGWRLTHLQARAALSIALRSPGSVRYADVALIATIAEDELLAGSLRRAYLVPLRQERDGGVRALATLRAYFAADGNVSSAAAILGVSRQTVTSRLRAIEARLDRHLSSCALEMQTALRLDELESGEPSAPAGFPHW